MAGRPAKRTPVKAKKLCPIATERECTDDCLWHSDQTCVVREIGDALRKLEASIAEFRKYV